MRRRTDFRKVLGVGNDAPPDEVKRAYRELAKRYHPDRRLDPVDARHAEERLKQINAAWNDYLESIRSKAPSEGPTPRRSPPRAPDDDAVAGDDYEAPAWRRRRAERPTRDRFRAERSRATRDRDVRERIFREQADHVRRQRDAEIDERVERDRARAAGILGLVAAAGLVGIVILLLFVLLYEFASTFD